LSWVGAAWVRSFFLKFPIHLLYPDRPAGIADCVLKHPSFGGFLFDLKSLLKNCPPSRKFSLKSASDSWMCSALLLADFLCLGACEIRMDGIRDLISISIREGKGKEGEQGNRRKTRGEGTGQAAHRRVGKPVFQEQEARQ